MCLKSVAEGKRGWEGGWRRAKAHGDDVRSSGGSLSPAQDGPRFSAFYHVPKIEDLFPLCIEMLDVGPRSLLF